MWLSVYISVVILLCVCLPRSDEDEREERLAGTVFKGKREG